ncbi:AHH domain-containing protein, partial [Clostridium felsineum]|uniref:AHH domain-containing protein n=1 Tax=Clostridium felsineum TaxID=36839 RepID=UPI00214D6CBE
GNLCDLVKNYTNDILVDEKVNATKMNDLKIAIQNNKFSADEIKQISAYMDSLGITEEYYSVMKTIDIGKHLKNIKGAPPQDMINAHAHHILFKTGLGKTQKKLVLEGQKILRKYGIDPIIGGENLVWAPNGVIGQHNLDAIQNVVNQLKAVEDAGGDYDDIVEVLEELGELASQR